VSAVHYFGIRHHGPGSARSLVHALAELDPDAVLLEGPPEANELLSLASHTELVPPVALLIYAPKSTASGEPSPAALYPFAHYSPEWQAIQFALRRGRMVRFIDLPQAQRSIPLQDEPSDDAADSTATIPADFSDDPLTPMAQAAGYNDTERWWDHLVESRSGHDLEVFAAIHTMMTELRAARPTAPASLEGRREAHMRQGIRAATAEGFATIAVVCGAWHTPGLALEVSAKADAALLKGATRTKMAAAWVPWSYERMAYDSGYGAGVESPLWYELLWDKRDLNLSAEWLTRAARLLRAADLPVSSAHVIEACRLAETLAALRERPVPGLPEYEDAARSVLGGGDAANLARVRDRWYCGDRLGVVPATFPSTPLQQDLAGITKRLRFPTRAEPKQIDLDLRETNDRARSVLLRRLRILGVPWGEPLSYGGDRGTFHERWQIAWQPEFELTLIEASSYGHTLEQAATVLIMARSESELPLAELIALTEEVLFADLPNALPVLLAAVERRTAVGAAVAQLLDALPPLVGIARYGNVRGTDLSLVGHIVHSLVPRICIAVPDAARHIDEAAAQTLRTQLTAAERALGVLANEALTAVWQEMLVQLAAGNHIQPLLVGFANRLLYDTSMIDFDALATAFQRTLSVGNEPMIAAAWVEGLLSGSGAVLVHDDRLRSLLEHWVSQVAEEHFIQVLPLLRRAFAQFPLPVRRQISLRLRAAPVTTPAATTFDRVAAEAVIPVLQRIWSTPPLSPDHEPKS
jgi:hypothetical protein